ncbi:DgyrCDS8401 [Dimorphilus gyrociliatus]|uniref:DgyrCDS8401 n=1 Tax=Dimorphilus gyrociliatus TaxID=2664684 RepID=A0A7I8VVL4_9ANNE|nr:DgyrCDS8401 [Dimorphilus gyrociliatus]
MSAVIDSNEIKLLNKKRRDKEPLWLVKKMIENPKLAFGITLGAHVFMILLTILLVIAKVKVFPINFRTFPVGIKNSVQSKRESAWEGKFSDDPQRIRRVVINDTTPYWPRGHTTDDIEIFLKSKKSGNTIFTKGNLKQMKDIEEKLFKVEKYKDFCQVNKENKCLPPVSLIRFFDGTYSNVDPIFNDPDFTNINLVLYTAYKNPQTAGIFRYFLAKEHKIDENAKKITADLTRLKLPLGWPLENASTTSEDRDKIGEFNEDHIEPILKEFGKSVVDMKSYYYMNTIFGNQAILQAVKDMALAFGSMTFIFLFIWFQTKSLWITGWSLLGIIFCFFETNLIYRFILDMRYFGYFHIIAIFIILGIGADDIFVFFDTWKATGLESYNSLAHRLSDCYRRASGTMLFTSITTAAAFFASGASPILPIGTFGIFTGILVIVNYLSVIIFFPTVVLTSHLYWSDWKCPCCRVCSNRTHSEEDLSQEQNSEENFIVGFFRDKYFYFITNKYVKWAIIAGFTGLSVFFAWSASRVKIGTGEVEIFKKFHNLGQSLDYKNNAFLPSKDTYVSVIITWGMKERDFSDCHKTDHECKGKQVWDNDFDMNKPANQLAIKNFCDYMENGLMKKKKDELKIDTVECFIKAMDNFIQVNDTGINNINPIKLPLNGIKVLPLMRNRTDIYSVDKLSDNFYRYFEIGTSYFLNNAYKMEETQDIKTYSKLIGESFDGENTQVANFRLEQNASDIFYGTKLRFAGIRVNLTSSYMELGQSEGLPLQDNWEEFVKEEVAKMPRELQNGFQLTENNVWHILVIQKELTRNALLGIIIGLCIAFPVLVIATENIIVGSLATLTIGFVTVGVIGLIPIFSWKLDVLVSLNLCLVVGLSVDYVVHLAEAYHLSVRKTRPERVQDALEHIGLSVLSGALTTLGASFFMIFSGLVFFFQFGLFMFTTIALSLLYSMVFFMTVLSIIGPQGQIGCLRSLFRIIKGKILGKIHENEQKCTDCKGKGYVPIQTELEEAVIERIELKGQKEGVYLDEVLRTAQL